MFNPAPFPCVLMLLAVLNASCLAADFRVDSLSTTNGRSELRFFGDVGFYYILWCGDSVADIRLATDLTLNRGAQSLLSDTSATTNTRFYRVEKISLTSLRDTDGDGICDAWELLHRHAGAALNPLDANEDHDANGVADRTDALRESLQSGAVRGRPVIAAGVYHSLAIKTDGTLWGWGNNNVGELGSSDFTETNVPTQIGSGTNWSAVSVGTLSSYALKFDGTLWVWGQIIYGSNLFTPTQIGTNTDWIGLPRGAAEYNPTALRADGTRWQFGRGFTNIQPYGSSNDWTAVTDDKISGQSAGHWAIKKDGTLWKGVSLFDTNPVWSATAVGLYHALGLQTNGTLWAWVSGCCANAVDGQLGLGTDQPFAPVQVGTDTWAAVSAGWFHSVGIKSDGSLWWWGINYGFEPNETGLLRTNVPARVGNDANWVAVAAGNSHTVALRADGTIWTFGANELGKLGNGTVAVVKSPAQIGSAHDWSGVAVGTSFSFGLKTNGTLWAWGLNSYGALGLSDFVSGPALRQVPGSNWTAVSGGADHTTALHSDGSLWVWGKYVYTNGNNIFTNTPTRLGSDTDWQMISAGRQHSLALKTDGSLWSWGNDSQAELGMGGSATTPTPQRVGSAFWTNISAGANNSLGIQTSRSLWTWGRSPGTSPSTYFSPQQIGFTIDWKLVANAKAHDINPHALAVKRNGTLWSWGYNIWGALGNGSFSFEGTGPPTPVGTSTNWSQISVGDLFSAALQNDGSLWMTGFNWYGQLGFGTRTDTNLFTRVGSDTNWTSIAAGHRHMLALKSDGSIWAWGDNSYGQCAQPALFEPSAVAGTNWGAPRR